MLSRVVRSIGAAATDADEFAIPREEVIAAHHIPLDGVGRARVSLMLSADKPGRQVLVITVGRRSAEPVVRVQSSCLYGETFGSLDCDCGDQLRAALVHMKRAGSGILIYLDQEGRGAGLSAKALAYELAERLDFDTYNAYSRIGFEHDLRSYSDAVRVLRLLDVSGCALLTNNPAKVKALEDAGIAVQRRSLWVQKGAFAQRTRAAKRAHGYLA